MREYQILKVKYADEQICYIPQYREPGFWGWLNGESKWQAWSHRSTLDTSHGIIEFSNLREARAWINRFKKPTVLEIIERS